MKSTKYQVIFETLERDLVSGKYALHRRLPSEAELCHRFNVSRPTAARALRELQQLGLITRRAGSGSYPTAPKSAPHDDAARTLGLIVPGLGHTEILDPIAGEINRYAQALGSTVLSGDGAAEKSSGEAELELCRHLLDRAVDGVFFAPIESLPDRAVWNQRIAGEFLNHAIPMVLLDRDLGEYPERSKFDLIGIDNVAAAMEVTAHLVAGGCRSICFLARPHYPSTTDLRLLGCREAVRRSECGEIKISTRFGEPSDSAFVAHTLQETAADAFLCSNDQTAALLIRTLGQLGKEIPEQIAVAGFDDVQYATLLAPPLTTIRQPCREIGRSAVQLLLHRIADPALPPRQVLHSHQLIVRGSTRLVGAVSEMV